jgi:hypothetical protein
MVMKKLFLFIVAVLISSSGYSQLTWSQDIAAQIYTNCSKCHNINGIAPFTLMSYTDVVQNATDIRSAVLDHSMPPWPPDPNYSQLAHERVLSSQQINDIVNWIDNGMALGDSTLEPAPPVFNAGSDISNPDLVLSAPVYNVNTTSDLYRCFVVPTGLNTQQYITGLEAVPGNRNIVHHILIYSDTSNTPLIADANDPGPGYTAFGGTGSNSSKLIGVWVPGQSAYYTPAGMGIKLPANTNVILQIHYPGGIIGQTDSTKLYLKLSSAFNRDIAIESPLNHYFLDQGWLIIPANTTRTFTANYTVPYDVSTLAVGPHMHLIGKSIITYGVTPASDTIPLIDIPEWDFHWQGLYSFPRVLKIPAGTTLYSSAEYDNTNNNPHNPNNPPHLVTLGESTTDEMMLIYFAYTFYLPGDENIIIDSTLTEIQPVTSSAIHTSQLYDPAPNPVNDNMTIQYFLPKAEHINLSVVNSTGQQVLLIKSGSNAAGLNTVQQNLSSLSSGIYFLTLQAGSVERVKKFVVNR